MAKKTGFAASLFSHQTKLESRLRELREILKNKREYNKNFYRFSLELEKELPNKTLPRNARASLDFLGQPGFKIDHSGLALPTLHHWIATLFARFESSHLTLQWNDASKKFRAIHVKAAGNNIVLEGNNILLEGEDMERVNVTLSQGTRTNAHTAINAYFNYVELADKYLRKYGGRPKPR